MTPPGDDVVVVGDVLIDIVVVPEGPLVRGSDTAASIRSMGGGAAANTACWLASVGRQVRLVAAVGDDALGRTALDDLMEAGVRWDGVVLPATTTGSCVVLIDADGERTMLPDRGANDALPTAAVIDALEDRPRWLHLSGYALLGEGSRAAALAAAERARSRGIPISVDAASAAPLRAVGDDVFLDWVEGCTILFANDDEVAALGGTDAILAACRQLVSKHGADGASWTDGASTRSVPAVPVDVVDTVGAGDAFDAGFVGALLDGAGPGRALERGAVVAARAVAQSGARP